MREPALVIMAAGIGSRYGGIKQIDPVGPKGEIIIDYSIYDAMKAGFKKIIFVIRKDIEEAFREKVGKNIDRSAETIYVYQELSTLPRGITVPPGRKKPWGTGHAVLCCKDVIDAPFAVINADDFYGASAFTALFNFLKQAGDADDIYNYCLVGYVLKNALSEHGYVSRGICSVSKDGYLKDVHERTKIQKFGELIKYTEDNKGWVEISGDSIVSLNTWGFTPSLFEELETRFIRFLEQNSDNFPSPQSSLHEGEVGEGANLKAEYFLPDVVGELIKEGKARVKVLRTAEKWYGVTYKEDMSGICGAIRDLIAKGGYPQKLWI